MVYELNGANISHGKIIDWIAQLFVQGVGGSYEGSDADN